MGDYVELSLCPICSSSVNTSSDGEFFRCVRCGMVRTKHHYNHHIYNIKYAKNFVEYSKTSVNVPLNLFRMGLASRWLKEGDALLDVGCCIGEFIRFCEHYYRCYGFEPNKDAVQLARKRCESVIYTELNGSIPKVNAITLFDVLEHMEYPQVFLKEVMEEYLLPGGVIIITTPNADAIPKWKGSEDQLKAWKHYKPLEHLWLFTEDALTQMCLNLSMTVLHFGQEESDIRPNNPNGDLLTCVLKKSERTT